MCTHNAISSHTDHFEILERNSEEITVESLYLLYLLVLS